MERSSQFSCKGSSFVMDSVVSGFHFTSSRIQKIYLTVELIGILNSGLAFQNDLILSASSTQASKPTK